MGGDGVGADYYWFNIGHRYACSQVLADVIPILCYSENVLQNLPNGLLYVYKSYSNLLGSFWHEALAQQGFIDLEGV